MERTLLALGSPYFPTSWLQNWHTSITGRDKKERWNSRPLKILTELFGVSIYSLFSVYYCEYWPIDPFHPTSSSEKSWMRHTGGQFHCAFLYNNSMLCVMQWSAHFRRRGVNTLKNLTAHQYVERGIIRRVWRACKGSMASPSPFWSLLKMLSMAFQVSLAQGTIDPLHDVKCMPYFSAI